MGIVASSQIEPSLQVWTFAEAEGQFLDRFRRASASVLVVLVQLNDTMGSGKNVKGTCKQRCMFVPSYSRGIYLVHSYLTLL